MDTTLVKLEAMLLPPSFYAAVRMAQRVAPDAILAGGALRDFINGAPIKDLDIFVGPCSEGVTNLLENLNGTYGVEGKTTVPYFIAERMNKQDVHACYEHIIMGAWVVNTVVLSRPMTIAEKLNRFDFGICQVGFDGTDVWATPAFHQDRMNQTFTLVRCDSERDYRRSMARFDRLVQKYPDWQLVLTGVKANPKELAAQALFGRTIAGSKAAQVCVSCDQPATEFRDALSHKEYGISGLCQSCQDQVFGA